MKKKKPIVQKKAKTAGVVRAKKHLGQHFLKDEATAEKIGDTLTLEGYTNVLEIGPGMGVLTKYLVKKNTEVIAMDLDTESIAYLEQNYPDKNLQIIEADFLKYDLSLLFGQEQFAITGNFPYNISTQIVFKMLEWKAQIPEFTGMFQKEVAKRICEKEGSKAYGILSVLAQAFYEAEYLFTVPPSVFNPPPKVDSGVLRLKRKADFSISCSEKMLYKVVKTAFQQRRKTLRNSLKNFNLSDKIKEDSIFGQRPEQLSVSQFITLTQKLENDAISTDK
ncbi:16S rRNA (adenine(1518)-N(6)/adenine(1519)-N(6))-dimethyltransferase RsmA [Aequorivita marina]|uniref:16S rRNA (adenine(1518)-N(6)/adenine(1519)-N(6))- dimethyltransferase RsmA n=1 Tax=Aequorivita marina TaxID=3073654 RepID=UPI002874308A|nr:16S rRNA (adenine(1518)-N(6)/adenine(1519)-N(6))-dimethyltransferase RsmA [Aequorivita sp. S2608]MDS1297412.1 16S rRNA (adenine(1518)-N(6)/adenine(1519)-N(6))-dimethyltransferase RsmA [Aequorivita sp. S2608]